MKRDIKAVILDVGGVVIAIDWLKPFHELKIFDPLTQQRLLQQFATHPYLHRYERGEITEAEFLSGLGEIVVPHTPADFALDQEKLLRAWNNLILYEVPGIQKVFDELKALLPIYALSNINHSHYTHMCEHFAICEQFDKFFASHFLGERKPDREIYLKVLAEIRLSPQQILFIDDTPQNVAAARSLGWNAELSDHNSEHTQAIIREYLPIAGRRYAKTSKPISQ